MSPAIIEFGCGRVTMPRRLLHVLQQCTVLERRSDEGRPHRVGRVATRQADPGRVLPHQPVNMNIGGVATSN